MSKVLYNVTVSIDIDAEKDWLQWMMETHIPEVMATGFFLENRICKVIDEHEEGGKTYAIQYTCSSMQDLIEYQRDCAPALQADHQNKFGGKFAAFRTILEIIQESPHVFKDISAN